MPQATRLGDLDSGHDNCAGTALNSASSNVFINGKGAGRIGDSYVVHSCPAHVPHVAHIASGSATVFINGKKSARIGDAIDCGGNVAQASPNVFVGD